MELKLVRFKVVMLGWNRFMLGTALLSFILSYFILHDSLLAEQINDDLPLQRSVKLAAYVASANSFTGVAAALILPQETASSGEAPESESSWSIPGLM
jgi:hypothetical protein